MEVGLKLGTECWGPLVVPGTKCTMVRKPGQESP